MRAVFRNIYPWNFGSELIEITHKNYGRIDLHNHTDLLQVTFSTNRTLTFHLRPTNAREITKKPNWKQALLLFAGVSDIKATQLAPYPGDETLIHGWDYYEDDPEGPPIFEFSGGMIDISYRAVEVVAQIQA